MSDPSRHGWEKLPYPHDNERTLRDVLDEMLELFDSAEMMQLIGMRLENSGADVATICREGMESIASDESIWMPVF